MSSTNCLRPRSGFCLNLRVRIVNSTMATYTHCSTTANTDGGYDNETHEPLSHNG